MNKTTLLSIGLVAMTVVALIGWTKEPGRAQETTPTDMPVQGDRDRSPSIMHGTYGTIAYPNGNVVLITCDHGEDRVVRVFHVAPDGTTTKTTEVKIPDLK